MACATTTMVASGKFIMELSEDASAWTSVGEHVVSVTIEQTKKSSDVFVGGSDYATILTGAYEPAVWTVRGLFAETTAKLWEMARTAWADDACIAIRLTPKGSAAGNDQFVSSLNGSTAGLGVLVSLSLPAATAGSADPVPCGFVLRSPGFARTDQSA
jgi:hypothetical protein